MPWLYSLIYFYFLAAPRGFWDLSSPIPQAPGSGYERSRHGPPGIPSFLVVFNVAFLWSLPLWFTFG